MKKTVKMGVALLMALVMTLNLPLGVSASQEQYVSEVKIGYGESGKKALKEAGYTLRDDLNLNPGGEGGDVWLGYKTTYNKEEAITDMALMQQGGGYDFQGWSDELEELQEEISTEMDRFEAAVEEFQKNLSAGSPYAEIAKKILNVYVDDDLNDETTDDTGYAIGDLFEKYGKTPAEGEKAVTKDNLVVIFMQGNATSLKTIRYYLALGCVEYSADYNGENFIDRIEEFECNGEAEPNVSNADRQVVFEALTAARAQVEAFEKTQEEISQYPSEEEYLETLSAEEQSEYANDLVFYEALKTTQYTNNLDNGEGGFTFLDLLKLPTEYVDDETLFLEDFLVDPLIDSLTDGELALIGSVGLNTIFTVNMIAETAEASEQYLENAEKRYKDLEAEAKDGAASVYDGVDRSLFYDRDTVALTSKALRDKAASAGSDFGKTEEKSAKLNYYALGLAGGLLIGGAVCIGLAWRSLGISKAADAFLSMSGQGSGVAAPTWFSNAGSTTVTETTIFGDTVSTAVNSSVNIFRTVMTGLGVIAIIAALVLTIITLVNYWQSKKDTSIPEVDYTEIPRVLMDLRYKGENNTDKYYVPYYAAKNVEAPEGSTNSLELYGDLNAFCKHCVWLVLYTTKDVDAGTPLTPDFKIVTKGSGPEGYLGVHMFNNVSAANLNQYQVNGAGAVYLYVKQAASAGTGTGSVFAENPAIGIVLAIGTFIIGAAVSALAVNGYYKKKEKAQA